MGDKRKTIDVLQESTCSSNSAQRISGIAQVPERISGARHSNIKAIKETVVSDESQTLAEDQSSSDSDRAKLFGVFLALVWSTLFILCGQIVGWEEAFAKRPVSLILLFCIGLNLLVRIFIYFKKLRIAPHIDKRSPGDWPECFKNSKVSIIAPAYNEEAGVEGCIRAAMGSTTVGPDKLEMIVVDDQSKDGTLAAMRRVKDVRFKPVAGMLRTKTGLDWKGKNWACYQGYKEATGDILIFMDSDITFLPGAIESMLHGLSESGADWLTCNCFSTITSFWEYAFNIPLQIGINQALLVGEINSGRKIYAYGPLNVFHRKTYEALGGHRAVGHKVAESHHMALKAKEMGLKIEGRLCFQFAALSWYSNFEECWSGQLKSVVARVCEQKRLIHPFVGLGIAVFTALRLLPWVLVVFHIIALAAGLEPVEAVFFAEIILSVFDITLVYLQRQIGKFYCGYPTAYWWLEPVGAMLTFAMFVRALVKPEAKWGGHSSKSVSGQEKKIPGLADSMDLDILLKEHRDAMAQEPQVIGQPANVTTDTPTTPWKDEEVSVTVPGAMPQDGEEKKEVV